MAWTPGAILTAAQLDDYAPQAWTTWSPTFTNAGVAIAHTVIYARYVEHGKSVLWACQVNMTASGGGPLRFTLPVAAAQTNALLGIGRENVSLGTLWQVVTATSTTANVFRYDNTTTITNGNVMIFSGTYEAA